MPQTFHIPVENKRQPIDSPLRWFLATYETSNASEAVRRSQRDFPNLTSWWACSEELTLAEMQALRAGLDRSTQARKIKSNPGRAAQRAAQLRLVS